MFWAVTMASAHMLRQLYCVNGVEFARCECCAVPCCAVLCRAVLCRAALCCVNGVNGVEFARCECRAAVLRCAKT